MITRAKEISSRFLSNDERVHVADLVCQGADVRTIAKELRRRSSTMSRELRRNRVPSETSSALHRSACMGRGEARSLRRLAVASAPFPFVQEGGVEPDQNHGASALDPNQLPML